MRLLQKREHTRTGALIFSKPCNLNYCQSWCSRKWINTLWPIGFEDSARLRCRDTHYTFSSHVTSSWTDFHLASHLHESDFTVFPFFSQARHQLCFCTLDKGQIVDPNAKREELSVTRIFTLAAHIMDLALGTLGGKCNGTWILVFFFAFLCSGSFPDVPKCSLSLPRFLLCNWRKVRRNSWAAWFQ